MNTREIEPFCRENNVELFVLFGSHARGTVHPRSDIDVAIKIKRGASVSKLDLLFRLGGMFGDKEIDLVVLADDTDPLLLYEIFMNGQALYEERKGIFMEEKLRAWKLYLDTERLRKMQRDHLRKFGEKASNVA